MLLTAGHLIGIFVQNICDVKAPGHFLHFFLDLLNRCVIDRQGQRNIFGNGQRVQKIEVLKDKAEIFPAEPGQCLFLDLRYIGSIQVDVARADRINRGNAVQQRCACARAIINKPKLILADEPTGALDSHSSQLLLSTMQSINEQLGATILMVTHDAFSASYANRILLLRDGVIFTEILKGSNSRRAFFEKVLDVQTAMRGN